MSGTLLSLVDATGCASAVRPLLTAAAHCRHLAFSKPFPLAKKKCMTKTRTKTLLAFIHSGQSFKGRALGIDEEEFNSIWAHLGLAVAVAAVKNGWLGGCLRLGNLVLAGCTAYSWHPCGSARRPPHWERSNRSQRSRESSHSETGIESV